jgi:hypothetical protein
MSAARNPSHFRLLVPVVQLLDVRCRNGGSLHRTVCGTKPLTNACRVVFFEIAGDAHLHVNVTHRHQTTAVRGWAGPAKLPEGFVHNRMFGETPSGQMLRHIREMVFAERM